MARDLEAGELAAAELDEVWCCHVDASIQNDAGRSDLAEPCIGYPDDLDLIDRWMLQQEGLHFHRINVLAADLEDLLVAPQKSHHAIVVHDRHIPGVQPAIGVDGLYRFLWFLVIA